MHGKQAEGEDEEEKNSTQDRAPNTPSQKTNAESAQIQSSRRKNMQRGSRYQHNEMPTYVGIRFACSGRHEGLGIIMKGADVAETAVA